MRPQDGIHRRNEDGEPGWTVYLLLALLFFAMLYPAYAGIPVSYGYAYVFRWLGIFGSHVGF